MTAPSYYLNHCWWIISEVLWHLLEHNFTCIPQYLNHWISNLTHWGLVTPYGARELGQHWLGLWLVAWRHQAITWNNFDWSSVKSINIHIRAISQEMPQPSITKICLKITCLKFHSNFSGVSELKLQTWLSGTIKRLLTLTSLSFTQVFDLDPILFAFLQSYPTTDIALILNKAHELYHR